MSLVQQISALAQRIAAEFKSQKPLAKTAAQTLPLIALGSTYSFDVALTGVTSAMTATVNCTTTLGFGTVLEAVPGADKVTINLKAGLAVAAGSRTFNIRVIK